MVPGGLSDLLDALAGTAPQQPAWSWIGDQRVAFWYRRLAHETAVHRWDAERAAGIAPAPIQPEELAADGVAEVFDTWLGHADPPYEGPPGTLHLHATDAEAEWLLTLQPPQVTAAPGTAGTTRPCVAPPPTSTCSCGDGCPSRPSRSWEIRSSRCIPCVGAGKLRAAKPLPECSR